MNVRLLFAFIICLGLFAFLVPGYASVTKAGTAIERIGPEEARAQVQAGKALLVCSYGDEKCGGILLEGAMLLSTFESKLSSLAMDQEIIFYCG
jgi:hypothetical protein